MYFAQELLYIFSLLIVLSSAVEVNKPRGVALTKNVFYTPNKNFTCLDGSLMIPFDYVNDDYCDCKDGSDEPGTPACPNGIFHCTNAGHKPMNIPSSRVNDGICDCCDASDEYTSSAQCLNNCRELGRKAREEAQKLAEVTTQGYQLRNELSKEGKRKAEEKRQQLEELNKQKEEADVAKSEKEAAKASIEELETAALDKYKAEEEEQNRIKEEQEKEQIDKLDALDAFMDLDANQDSRITVDEIQAKWVFDSNKDGIVTEEEARFFLNNNEEYTKDSFLNLGWILMKPHYSMLKMFKGPELTDSEGEAAEDSAKEETISESDPKSDLAEEESQYDEDDDEDNDAEEAVPAPEKEEEAAENVENAQPEYDEETQRLVDSANIARTEFKDANQRVVDLEREIRELKESMDIDFGEDDQFLPLHRQCFEYTDREYTYKLCMFDQVTQRPKAGGADTNLGRWGNWDGPENNIFNKMKYTNGLSCWNGPARSTEVRLSCGIETKLLTVSEPNRCIYVIEAETPAVCTLPVGNAGLDKSDRHEEL